MRRLGGSSYNLAETQWPKLAHEGLGKQPLLPNEKDARGSYKKSGELLIALSLRVEAWGLFLQPDQDPVTQVHTRGLSKQPLLLNEKDARGSHKKLGELLTALSLRAEARGLFLQTC